MTDHANAGYRRMFGDDGLSVGLFFPIAADGTTAPPPDGELALARRGVAAGFDALWVRDVPLYWPKFGEAGQVYDPWVFLSWVAARTDDVALAAGSIVLPLRHPLHVAKAAASVDRLSGGRLVLGVGSGDRPPEFGAFGVDEDDRGARFREAVDVLRTAWGESFPEVDSRFGRLDGDLDLRPEPSAGSIPLLVTGRSRQSLEWIGEHADGWLFYQLPLDTLEGFLADWREATPEPKPFAMGLGVDLAADPTAEREHVHQGFRAGAEWFVDYFRDLERRGVDHVAVSLRAGDRNPEAVLDEFATGVLDRL